MVLLDRNTYVKRFSHMGLIRGHNVRMAFAQISPRGEGRGGATWCPLRGKGILGRPLSYAQPCQVNRQP